MNSNKHGNCASIQKFDAQRIHYGWMVEAQGTAIMSDQWPSRVSSGQAHIWPACAVATLPDGSQLRPRRVRKKLQKAEGENPGQQATLRSRSREHLVDDPDLGFTPQGQPRRTAPHRVLPRIFDKATDE